MSFNSYLITGGLGVTGCAVIRKIAQQNASATIVVLDNLVSNPDMLQIPHEVRESKRFQLFSGDCNNEQLVSNLLNKYKVECLIDCASHSRTAVGMSFIQGARNAIQGLVHVLDAVRHYGELKSYVLVSSQAVYGQAVQIESSPLAPTTFVGAALMSAEAMLHSYVISYRVPAAIVRLTEGIAENIIHDIRTGSNVGNFINLQTADDAATGILLVAAKAKDARIYNIGGEFDYALDVVRQALGGDDTILPAQKSVSHFSINQAVENLGFHPVEFKQFVLPPGTQFTQLSKVLVFPANHPKADVVINLLKSRGIGVEKAASKPGNQHDKYVQDELVQQTPSHVVYLGGHTQPEGEKTNVCFEGGPDKLKINFNDNLLAPWLVTSFCAQMGIRMIYLNLEDAESMDELNSYTAVKQFTDRLMKHFPDMVHLNMPITSSAEVVGQQLLPIFEA